MKQAGPDTDESMAAIAFTRQAAVFDSLYREDAGIQYKRNRVRQHISRYLRPGSRLLELNCGTGEDALFFANNDYHVHATDISTGMLDALDQKKSTIAHPDRLTTEQCSFLQLNDLKDKGLFDHIYSNFGGLNCTGEVNKVLGSLSPLLKPGGTVTLVIISKFCLWEFLLLFRGKFKTAFRRFFSASGRKAHIEGAYFNCWYYSPSHIRKHLKNDYKLLELEGLCTIVPPSYIEGFAAKHPKLFRFLEKREDRYGHGWPWRSVGDYFIITFKKT